MNDIFVSKSVPRKTRELQIYVPIPKKEELIFNSRSYSF